PQESYEPEWVRAPRVSRPATPNPLPPALRAGALKTADIKELFDLRKPLCAEAQDSEGRLPSAGASPSPLGGERAGVRGSAPITHHDSRITSPFHHSPADRVPDTSALGSAIDEARLLHLTKQMNEIRAVLKRA